MAETDVQPADDYQSSIVRAIRGAKALLIVFTANANESKDVSKEVALANKYGAMIIPCRLEDVAPNDALEYEVTTRQWLDLFGDWEPALDRLAQRIGPEAGSAGEQPPELKRRPEPAPDEKQLRAQAFQRLRERYASSIRRDADEPVSQPELPMAQRWLEQWLQPGRLQIRVVGAVMLLHTLGHALWYGYILQHEGWPDGTVQILVASIAVALVLEAVAGAALLIPADHARWPAFALNVVWTILAVFLLNTIVADTSIGPAVIALCVASLIYLPLLSFVLWRWRPTR
jgi:hypothetical protein